MKKTHLYILTQIKPTIRSIIKKKTYSSSTKEIISQNQAEHKYIHFDSNRPTSPIYFNENKLIVFSIPHQITGSLSKLQITGTSRHSTKERTEAHYVSSKPVVLSKQHISSLTLQTMKSKHDSSILTHIIQSRLRTTSAIRNYKTHKMISNIKHSHYKTDKKSNEAWFTKKSDRSNWTNSYSSPTATIKIKSLNQKNTYSKKGSDFSSTMKENTLQLNRPSTSFHFGSLYTTSIAGKLNHYKIIYPADVFDVNTLIKC